MFVSPGMQRLLRIRKLQEEHRLSVLENALRELGELRAALAGTGDRERLGRELVREGARLNDLSKRLAGIAEESIARRWRVLLSDRIAEAEQHATVQRESYLVARIERRQAMTLLEKALNDQARKDATAHQSALDEWYRSRT